MIRQVFFATLALLCGLSQSTVQAADWSSTNIQAMKGSGFTLGSRERTTVTLEHASGWRYGNNFFFVDVTDRSDVGSAFYAEAYPSLSLSQLTGVSFRRGVVKDLSIIGGVNAGSEPRSAPFRAWLGGTAVAFDAPGFTLLKVDVLAYHAEGVSSTGVQISPVWDLSYPVAGVPVRFRGFLDFISAEGTGSDSTVLTQPQLLVDVSPLWGAASQLYLGLEYSYWHNKFGIKGVTERAPQAMLLWTL